MTLGASHTDSPVLGFVAIGRNEGKRLVDCLDSLLAVAPPAHIAYVDSGSTDDSLAEAHRRSIIVVDLNDGHAFTAARARNKGFTALIEANPAISHVMFIDGDCALIPDFIDHALESFARDDTKKLALVTGFTRERFPERTIYNQMCDIEWHGPVGTIEACGGIFMIRRAAFVDAGGFNPTIIAAEDDELCIRVRVKGYHLQRIDQDMCLHDAAMTRFGQWWRRSERAGHAYALVGDLHPGYFKAPRRRAIVWGAVLPLVIIIGLLMAGPWALLLLGLYAISFLRTRQGLMRENIASKHATPHAGFLVLAKFANLTGMVKHWWKRWRGQTVDIVEYK